MADLSREPAAAVATTDADADAERRRLRARIAREFDIVTDRLTIGGQALDFTRVSDPDAVLDAVCEQEQASRERGVKPRRTLRMPYWAAVWESALAVGEHLAARDATQPLSWNATLDLGCGMGLAGMAMASRGARVTLVDIDTACLLFAQLNVWLWRERCRVRRCDWQTDDLRERFDLIVGSDVLYERGQWEFIEPFLRRHLAPGGTVLIGEPGRPTAEPFPNWIRSRGWLLSSSQAIAGKRTVNVLQLTLPQPQPLTSLPFRL